MAGSVGAVRRGAAPGTAGDWHRFPVFGAVEPQDRSENVALPLAWLGVVERDIKARVGELLESVGLSHKADARPAQLSGGQRQRALPARWRCARPFCWRMKPPPAFDPQATASVLALLKRLRDEYQLAIVLITHEMDAVRTAADAVAEIRDGRSSSTGGSKICAGASRFSARPAAVAADAGGSHHSDLLLRLSYRWDVPVATDWISRLSQQWALRDRSPWRSRRGD